MKGMREKGKKAATEQGCAASQKSRPVFLSAGYIVNSAARNAPLQAGLEKFHLVDGESSNWEIQCALSVRGWRKAARKGSRRAVSGINTCNKALYGETL